tara:strand:+ start:1160 stop:1696 length:537 start_codon:yes stop_codon:yes gene_type:complete
MAKKKGSDTPTRKELQKMLSVVLYMQGHSTREIGPIVGVDPRTVQRYARQAGVHRPRAMSDEEIMQRQDLGPQILAAYEAGSTMGELALRFNISTSRVKRLLIAGKVKLRPAGSDLRVMTEEDISIAKSMYPRLSFEKLSEMLGFDRKVIANTLRSEGVHILPRGGHVHRKVLYPDSK